MVSDSAPWRSAPAESHRRWLAFLRVVVKPSDTLSWFRALKLIDHIGDATVYQILEHLGVEQKEFRSARSKAGLFKKLQRFPARAALAGADGWIRLADPERG